MSVADLIEHLQGMPKDATVLLGADYGDYGRTTQALFVEECELVKSAALYSSAYSRSGIAINEDHEDEVTGWLCDTETCPGYMDEIEEDSCHCEVCGRKGIEMNPDGTPSDDDEDVEEFDVCFLG